MFHVAVLAPNAESRSPNQFRPERIRFTSWSSRTPYATCWVRTSSTPPSRRGKRHLCQRKCAGASVRRNHLPCLPTAPLHASTHRPLSRPRFVWLACQHISSPGSNDPSSNPVAPHAVGERPTAVPHRCPGQVLPTTTVQRRFAGSMAPGSIPEAMSSSYPKQCTPLLWWRKHAKCPWPVRFPGQFLVTRWSQPVTPQEWPSRTTSAPKRLAVANHGALPRNTVWNPSLQPPRPSSVVRLRHWRPCLVNFDSKAATLSCISTSTPCHS